MSVVRPAETGTGGATDRVSAFEDDALGDLDVIDAAIARAEAVNPALNGVAYAAFDTARSRGRTRRTYGGYVDGVPSFIKDNVAVAGMPTMSGTDAWDPKRSTDDGDFAHAFQATGLVPLGKTRLSRSSASAPRPNTPGLGPVSNPWSTEHTAGASSSGSGAFVAAGVVPIAHANDGDGSIRIPGASSGWWVSSHRAAASHWTGTCDTFRCASSITGC